MRDDTQVRQVARKHPGSLASTIVSFARQVGHAQGAGELEATANIQRLAVSYLDRALLAQARPKFPVSAESKLTTLAEALEALMSGQLMTAMDTIGQRFRAVETAVLEEGGWSEARPRSSPRNQSELSDPWPATHDGGGGTRVPSAQAGPLETAAGYALETVDRASELKKKSGRSQSTWDRGRSPQRSGPKRVEGEEKDQRRRKKRQHSKEDRHID